MVSAHTSPSSPPLPPLPPQWTPPTAENAKMSLLRFWEEDMVVLICYKILKILKPMMFEKFSFFSGTLGDFTKCCSKFMSVCAFFPVRPVVRSVSFVVGAWIRIAVLIIS